MKAVLVKRGARYSGQECRCCTRKIKVGQVIVAARNEDAIFGHRDFLVHRSCMASLLAGAPQDADETAFETIREVIRDRIVTTGTPFSRLM